MTSPWRYRLQGVAATLLVLLIVAIVHFWVGSGWFTYLGWKPRVLDVTVSSQLPLATPRSDIPGLENFAQVSRNLYRGAGADAVGYRALKAMGVRTIVDLQQFHSDHRALQGLGLNYVHIPMNPAEIDDDEVAAFLQVVRNPELQPVFVHCRAGSDRTGVVVAIYRVMEQGWSVTEAAQELPHFGFHEVFVPLQQYLKGLDLGEISRLAATQPPPRVVVVP
ncbi:MAG: tyrosine-protein phosphatase [Armatimonadetes bacterium]|nr:tyrosine-protein phosphatase [Armatimonadota bacterium]